MGEQGYRWPGAFQSTPPPARPRNATPGPEPSATRPGPGGRMLDRSHSKPYRAGPVLATIAVAVAVLVTGCSSGGDHSADPPRPDATSTTRVTTTTKPEPILRSVPVPSTYETAARSISRDGGVSVALPDGRALWLFGDTGIYERSPGAPWNETTFIDGSSAMIARFTL